MKDISAVIFDLDDTLLRSDKSISDYSLEILNKCRERKIYIGVATARSEILARSYIRIEDFDIVISNGGARMTVGGKCVYKKMMSANTVRKIIDVFFGIGGDELTVETDEGYFWNYKTKPEGSWAHAIYNDFLDFNSPAYKITAQLDRSELAQHICNEVGGIETLSFRGENWHRFASVGADKVSAIRAVTKHLALSNDEDGAAKFIADNIL